MGGGGWWCIGQRPGQVSFISLRVRGSLKLELVNYYLVASDLSQVDGEVVGDSRRPTVVLWPPLVKGVGVSISSLKSF